MGRGDERRHENREEWAGAVIATAHSLREKGFSKPMFREVMVSMNCGDQVQGTQDG